MYQVYIKKESGFNPKKLIGEFKEYEQASEKIESELAKNPDIKYVIEETTGRVDNYGDLIATVVEEN